MKLGPAQRRYATIAEIASELRMSVESLAAGTLLDGVRSAKVGRSKLYLWADVDRIVFGRSDTHSPITRSPETRESRCTTVSGGRVSLR